MLERLLDYGEGLGKMGASYEFSLGWPPSINSYWATFRNRRIISKRGREYKKDSIEEIRKAGLIDEKISGRVSFKMVMNPPSLRKYDIDNFCKSVFDSLSEAGFWLDDEQVYRLTIVKGEKIKGGRIDLKIDLIGQ